MKKLELLLATLLSENIGKLILRLSIGTLMLFHGIKKLTGGIGGIKYLVTNNGLPEILAYGVYIGEIILPILIILGLFTRFASLGLAATMGFAIFLAHSKDLFLIGKNGGLVIELPLLFLLASVAITFIGAGKYSLDKK
ncbi:DoxX family protein [Arcobacter sp. LA11]|uniref:DoxX family protein n=1 Tax=Arcobacter sp. LA11 TaxID=1898176 RepID=UPI000934FFD3|nr:DoxX family protein [Arcobacter sp. LA11]